MASMLEIMQKGAELVNAEEEFVDQMVELDGDIIFWRFEDDQPAVTTRLDKGVIVVEEGENPDSQIGMQLKIKVLLDVLKSLQPFMPFISEELYQRVKNNGDPDASESIMVAGFPVPDESLIDDDAERQMDLIMKVISTIRNLRSEVQIEPKKYVDVALCSEEQQQLEILKAASDDICLLAKVNELSFLEERKTFPRSISMVVPGGVEAHLLLKEIPDLSAEISRLKKALQKLEKELNQSQKKLANQKFLSNAPEEVIEKERKKAEDGESNISKLQGHLARIEKLAAEA